MTGLEALEKIEANVRTVIGNKREEYDWEKNTYKESTPDDPYRDYHLQNMRRTFREIQTLKTVLIWIDDAKEECEEET